MIFSVFISRFVYAHFVRIHLHSPLFGGPFSVLLLCFFDSPPNAKLGTSAALTAEHSEWDSKTMPNFPLIAVIAAAKLLFIAHCPQKKALSESVENCNSSANVTI